MNQATKRFAIITFVFAVNAACAKQSPSGTEEPVALDPSLEDYSVEVIRSLPHDTQAFTQGFIVVEGVFYESTGLYGESNIRKVDNSTGNAIKQNDLDSQYFGEGLTYLEGKFYQLTWKSKQGFVYQETESGFLLLTEDFTYDSEGWGLTTDGVSLILSDGTETLYFIDPTTKAVTKTLTVAKDGALVSRLNELEYIEGLIYANVWLTNSILAIDPKTGSVLREITIPTEELLGDLEESLGSDDVLNGIAFDVEQSKIYITGKRWPLVFEIQFKKIQ
ncbi:MAG: glutaminyl-peptide cyclotransferase [Pseudobacteriovorax sp.]|nr:glutaminyl-peptide cyclotransferase [Pseudobacteriovorax sp.]